MIMKDEDMGFLGGNVTVPEELHKEGIMLKGGKEAMLYMASMTEKTNKEELDLYKIKLAKDPLSCAEVLETLANDPNVRVRRWVANNTSAPKSVLEKLMADTDTDVRDFAKITRYYYPDIEGSTSRSDEDIKSGKLVTSHVSTSNEMSPLLKEKIDEFDKIVAEMRQIMINKNNDYGSDNIGILGEKGIFCRIFDKASRLKQLVWENKTNKVINESVDDTYKDLANYCIIAIIYRLGKWK